MGPSLTQILPKFKIYEWTQVENMGQQTGRKPWNPSGAGVVSVGRIFHEKDLTRSVEGP